MPRYFCAECGDEIEGEPITEVNTYGQGPSRRYFCSVPCSLNFANKLATVSEFDDRREFVGALESHDDVKAVNFTRDGYQTIIVEFVEITGEHDAIDRARDLDLDVERVDAYTYIFRET